jgi:hypothetical protein
MTTGVALACEGGAHGPHDPAGAAVGARTVADHPGSADHGRLAAHKGDPRNDHGWKAAPKPSATSSPSPTSTPTATAQRLAAARLLALPGAIEHGVFTVATGTGSQVVDVQRGTVAAGGSATSVSVTSADGFSATYSFDASSVVASWDKSKGGNSASSPADIHAGDRVEVIATTGGVVELLADFGPAKSPSTAAPSASPSA